MEKKENYPNTKLKLDRWPYILAICLIALIFWGFWNQKSLFWNQKFSEDELRASLIYELARLPDLEEGQPDSARVAANKVIKLADLLEDINAKAIAYYWLAKIQKVENKHGEDLAQALSYARISHTIFSTENDPIWLAQINCELSSIHTYLVKQKPSSIDSIQNYLIQASTWIPQIHNSFEDSLRAVGDINRIQATVHNILHHKGASIKKEEVNTCISFAKKSLSIYQYIGYREGQAICYRNLGTFYRQKQDLDSAIYFFNKALQLNEEMNSLIAQERTLRAMGECYQAEFTRTHKLDFFEKAIACYEEALAVQDVEKARTIHKKATAYHQAAYFAYAKDVPYTYKFNEFLGLSAEAYHKALDYAKMENHALVIRDVLDDYTELCEELNSEFDCKNTLKKANRIYFEITSKSREAQTLAVTELKNFELDSFQDKTEQKSRLLLFGATGLIMMVIMAFVFHFDRIRTRYYRDQIHANLKALQAQMNPHFISNSLNSIESLINLEKNREASAYLIKFSRLARMILGYSQETEISIHEEMKMLNLYLSLESLRLSNKFTYSITVDEKIDPKEIFIPPMMLQPFVENSIQHGIKVKKTQGNISVKFLQETPNLILCIVEDDGVGREKSRKLKAESAFPRISFSTQIIEKRIRNLKILKGGDLKITDLKDEKGNAMGTRVEIFIRILDTKAV